MPPPTGRPDPLGRLGLRTAWFCEQCGTNREQLGDEFLAPIRECPTCRQAACPNCWNIVASSCLRCVPFSLPIVETPTPEPAVLSTFAATVVSAAAASVESEPPAGKTDRLRRRLAKVVPTVPAVESPLPAMVLTPPTPATPTADPPPQPASPDRKAKGAAKAAAAAPEVQWPDRSADWEIRANATTVDRPLPSRPEPAAPGSAARHEASVSRPVAGRRLGRSRVATLAGLTVVIVAVFGVAGLTLTALGRLPGSDRSDGQTTTPLATERVTVPGAAATTPGFVTPPDDAPPLDENGSKDHPGIKGGGSDGSTPGNGGAPGGGDTPLIGLTPQPTLGATPAPTGAATAAPTPTSAPTATPTPDPTPTPTPDPTPDPTPTPTPDPTPDPTPTPEPTD